MEFNKVMSQQVVDISMSCDSLVKKMVSEKLFLSMNALIYDLEFWCPWMPGIPNLLHSWIGVSSNCLLSTLEFIIGGILSHVKKNLMFQYLHCCRMTLSNFI